MGKGGGGRVDSKLCGFLERVAPDAEKAHFYGGNGSWSNHLKNRTLFPEQGTRQPPLTITDSLGKKFLPPIFGAIRLAPGRVGRRPGWRVCRWNSEGRNGGRIERASGLPKGIDISRYRQRRPGRHPGRRPGRSTWNRRGPRQNARAGLAGPWPTGSTGARGAAAWSRSWRCAAVTPLPRPSTAPAPGARARRWREIGKLADLNGGWFAPAWPALVG